MGETMDSDYKIHLLLEQQRNGKYCDLFLVPAADSDDEKNKSEPVPCHKVIVASVSPFLKEALEEGGNDDESSPRILSIPGITHKTLVVLVQYIYSGLINITPANVFRIFEGAETLQLSYLQRFCQDFIDLKFAPPNVIPHLNSAWKRRKCKEHCLQVFLRNYQTIQGIGKLDYEIIKKILTREKTRIVLSAEERLNLILKWLMENDSAEFRKKSYAFYLIKRIPLDEIPLKVLRQFFRHQLLKPKGIQKLYKSLIQEFSQPPWPELNPADSVDLSVRQNLFKDEIPQRGQVNPDRDDGNGDEEPQLKDPGPKPDRGTVVVRKSNRKLMYQRSVLVENILPAMKDSCLAQYFSTCGIIDSIRIFRRTFKYKGSASIIFRDSKSGKLALKKNGEKFRGQTLVVKRHKKGIENRMEMSSADEENS